MTKLKEGKLDRKWFWCVIIAVWVLMYILFMVGRSPEESISSGRLCGLMVLFVIYIAAIVMRLRDTGQSMALLIIIFIVPMFMIVIGCMKSQETLEMQEAEPEGEAPGVWPD